MPFRRRVPMTDSPCQNPDAIDFIGLLCHFRQDMQPARYSTRLQQVAVFHVSTNSS
jgi:hypothetical protein